MSEYRAISARIRCAKTSSDIVRMDKTLDRLYNAGILTPNQFGRLCTLLMERNATIETGES